MLQSAQYHISQESMTDQMLECIEVCKVCSVMLSNSDLADQRLKAIGFICKACEIKKYGSWVS